MSERGDAEICVPKDHPALPGHFPGTPIVPGVVVLDQVVCVAEKRLGRSLRIAGLPQAKFLAPLYPEERAQCTFELTGSRLVFRVEAAGRLIARGTFVLAEGATG